MANEKSRNFRAFTIEKIEKPIRNRIAKREKNVVKGSNRDFEKGKS